MAQVIKLKRGTTTPTTSDLQVGEVAIDTAAQKFYINDSGNIKEIGGGSGSAGLQNVVEDTTPQLGGDLDLNSNNITGTGNINITGTATIASSIDLVSPDTVNTISLDMLNSDTISFSGDSGELFSVTDSLTGTIFAVNDISGVPSIEVDDDGTVRFAEIDGNVLVGSSIDNGAKFQVSGDISLNSNLLLDTDTITLATTAQTEISSFSAASYSSGKFVIQATISGEVHVTEILVVHNGTTASATEYGVIHTGSAPLATYDVDISSENVRILATGASASSTTYKIVKNLINGS